MIGSILILLSFIVGLFLAVLNVIPEIEEIELYSKYLLYLLMLLVGLSLGLDKNLLATIKKQPKKMLLLPFATVSGTLTGAIIAAFVIKYLFINISTNISIPDVFSISSGYGYYSLSSIFLNESRGAEIGTIALATNILRELITIGFAPLMVKYFGKFAPICSGGATTMDVTLPVIQRISGNEYVPVSIYHGIVMDFSVPLFLTIFISIS